MNRRRKVAVLTVGRSDFSILRPLLHKLQEAPDVDAGLLVAGAHFDPDGGMTVTEVRASGVPVWGAYNQQIFEKTPAGTAAAMAQTLTAMSRILGDVCPDLLVILGDRFEAVAAGLAAVPFGIRLAHISGGSITRGATDDVYRHCLTKMAHLHFCDLPEFRTRIISMGEQPAFVFPHGALGIDGLAASQPLTVHALRNYFALLPGFSDDFALLNLHPETQNIAQTQTMVAATIAALEAEGLSVLATAPNADAGSGIILEALQQACARNGNWAFIPHLGSALYYPVMGLARFMIGNSSSGIIEAATMKLPVVNIGNRQEGRHSGANVLHVPSNQMAIAQALAQLKEPDFQMRVRQMENPYGHGNVAEKIMQSLRALDFGKEVPVAKLFYDGAPGRT
jgi:UDP-hydrolysing UDP-N-acetyl-D-glucosamine 2-epimerase